MHIYRTKLGAWTRSIDHTHTQTKSVNLIPRFQEEKKEEREREKGGEEVMDYDDDGSYTVWISGQKQVQCRHT